MKLLILLLLSACASHKEQTPTSLEFLNKKFEVSTTTTPEMIVIKKQGIPAMVLNSTTGNKDGYTQGLFLGNKNIKQERWRLDQFDENAQSHWIYEILLAEASTPTAKKLVSDSQKKQEGIIFSDCVSTNQNKYIVAIVLGDMGGLLVGCLN